MGDGFRSDPFRALPSLQSKRSESGGKDMLGKIFNFAARQGSTKTGKWGALGVVGAIGGAVTGTIGIGEAVIIGAYSIGNMFQRDRAAKEDYEKKRKVKAKSKR